METIIRKVTAIKEGRGRFLPEEIAKNYEAVWLIDPLRANVKLLFFELCWNDIPLPEGWVWTDIPLPEGSVKRVANRLDFLSMVRFGPEGYPDGWGIGIYGHSLPGGDGQIN